MNIVVTKPALQYYKREMDVKSGEFVRFFVRLGGCSTVQSGFSLGVTVKEPKEIGVSELIEEITFYIEESDLWFFDGHDLKVKYSRNKDEIEFEYK
jgi:uncharacterized protein YneR